MNRLRLLPALAAWATLAACEEAPYCELCLDNDPAKPVAAENVARIRLLHGDRPLPESATDVHIYEKCGIDCSQFIRFEAPLADARAFASSLPLHHPLTLGANPWGANPWGGGSPVWEEVIALGWWPRDLPPTIEGGDNMIADGEGPLQVALLPRGTRATVWVRAFDS